MLFAAILMRQANKFNGLCQNPGREFARFSSIGMRSPILHDMAPTEKLHMYTKPIRKFEAYDPIGFRLNPTDKDAHWPSLNLVMKARKLTHAAKHRRSQAGKAKDKRRRNLNKRAKKKEQAFVYNLFRPKAKAVAKTPSKAGAKAAPGHVVNAKPVLKAASKTASNAVSKVAPKAKVRRQQPLNEEDQRPPLKRRR